VWIKAIEEKDTADVRYVRKRKEQQKRDQKKSPRPGQPASNRTLVNRQRQGRLNPTTSEEGEWELASFEMGGLLQSLPQ